MAREPPAEPPRPPNLTQTERRGDSNKTQSATLSDSSHSSTNLQNTDAINTAISVQELEGTRKIISPGTTGLIREKENTDMDYPRIDASNTKNPADSAVQIDTYRKEACARSASKSSEIRQAI
ncbi:hypothetical protein RDI58_000948 [Solanum bulbocastanum]|uniref:Uncharacterized protein n=1 Tax=Solanum bulbocastanum TaxID=147425 RepID=A0AAN8U452_SOLBU